MRKHIIVWGMAILWGHQQNGHISWKFGQKEVLTIPSSIVICERGFSKQNAIKSRLRASCKLDTLKWVSLCRIELENMIGGQYLSYARTWEIGEFLDWTKYCKMFKLLYIYICKNIIWSPILCERLRWSQCVIWKIVFDVVPHIKRPEKEKENNNPSCKMKVDP